MALFSRIKVWTSGEILYASDLNNEFNNLLAGFTPNKIEGASANVAAMQSSVDPGELGTESLAGDVLGELQRLRFAVRELKGTTQWYETAATDLQVASTYYPRVQNLERWHDSARITNDGSDPGIGGVCYSARTSTSYSVTTGSVAVTTSLDASPGTLTLTTTGRPVEIGFDFSNSSTDVGVASGTFTPAGGTGGVFFQCVVQKPDTTDYHYGPLLPLASTGTASTGVIIGQGAGAVVYGLGAAVQSFRAIIPLSAGTYVFRPLVRGTGSRGTATSFTLSLSMPNVRAYAREL
jgi:hypothetical protein